MVDELEYIAIRMIVLNPNYPIPTDSNKTPRQDFEDWMTGKNIYEEDGFLHKMRESFHNMNNGSLLEILLLRGHKEDGIIEVAAYPHMSAKPAENREGSTSAGANADYAWMTRWKSRGANQDAWKIPKDDPNGRCNGWKEAWETFLKRCYPRDLTPGTLGAAFDTPDRPLHGPPFDYLGAPGLFPSRGKPTPHYGRGAGCLVEGFEVVDHWPRG